MNKKSMKQSVIFKVFGIVSLALLNLSAAWAEVGLPPAVPAGSVPTAGAAAPVAAAPQPPGLMGMLLPIVLMIGVFYFLSIRPQQKKMKLQQEMLGALKHGDEVLTSSGMLGKVTGITEQVVTLEVADNVRVKMLKSQVSQVVKGQIKELA